MSMNLVIIPMEGVSQTMLWQCREIMPTIWTIANRSLTFRRFYSSSTSAFQSFSDFLHGSSSELDHNLFYPSKPGCLLGRSRNLFSILRQKGYATLGIQHEESMPGYLRDNCLGAWPEECGEFRWHGDYDGFYDESLGFIERASKSGTPFALYYGDKASSPADACAEKRENGAFHQWIDKGFSLMDGSAMKLMEKLAALSLLNKTVVVFYGPYGMDLWRHGIATGRVHAIEPYADLCWTPLLIYFNDQNIETVENIASSIDVKATILGILFPGEDFGEPPTNSTGIDLFAMARTVAFSQNLFAMERENEGPARGLMKSYAATDGEQRLIITSDGGIPGEGGMELYYDMRDPGNTRNLLDFFQLDSSGHISAFGISNSIHIHFAQSFKPHLVNSIAESYNRMRDLLMRLVKVKESEAFQHSADKKQCKFFQESAFNHKRRYR